MQRLSSGVHACSENLIGPFQTGSHQTNKKTCQIDVKNLVGRQRLSAFECNIMRKPHKTATTFILQTYQKAYHCSIVGFEPSGVKQTASLIVGRPPVLNKTMF